MKNLLEIAKVVTRKKVRKIEILDAATLKNKTSKFREFYEALLSDKVKTDRDAAALIYGCSPTDDKYRQLKSRFQKRLVNTLFFIDVNKPSTASYDRAQFTCRKDWSLVSILQLNGAEGAAREYARKTLKTALKYGFPDLVVLSARVLRQHAAREGKEAAFEEYDQLLKENFRKLEAEIEAEECFLLASRIYQAPDAHSLKHAPTLDELRQRVVSLSELHTTPLIQHYMFLVWIIGFELQRDYQNVLEVCRRALEFFESEEVPHRVEWRLEIYRKQLLGYLHLKDFRKGRRVAERWLQYLSPGTPEWFAFMELYFQLAMHSEQFINALAILQEVFNNGKFRKQPLLVRERWEIFQAYLYFVCAYLHRDRAVLAGQRPEGFQPEKFLAKKTVFPKTQRVLETHFHICRFLLLLEANQLTDAQEALRVLKNFADRKLKPELHARLIVFVKLLHQMGKRGFEVADLGLTRKYEEELSTLPFTCTGKEDELEVLPLDWLWERLHSQVKV
ncbi:MAG: hypothetical protein D6765_09605 [Bacteroidetes bacterium]|nr:MAG: hypothetical protein D6765_09605 [Bacteroidota bacterium]